MEGIVVEEDIVDIVVEGDLVGIVEVVGIEEEGFGEEEDTVGVIRKEVRCMQEVVQNMGCLIVIGLEEVVQHMDCLVVLGLEEEQHNDWGIVEENKEEGLLEEEQWLSMDCTMECTRQIERTHEIRPHEALISVVKMLFTYIHCLSMRDGR